MGDSNFRGPVVSIGALQNINQNSVGTSVAIQPQDGPSMSYQGYAWLDPRAVPLNKDSVLPGQVPAFLMLSDFYAVDTTPQAANATALAASAAATAAVAVALTTTQVAGAVAGAPSIAVGVPVIPQGTTVATTMIALDFGFATGTTVANSSTVTVNDNTLFTLGQWIVIGGAGNSAATLSLTTQVTAISGTTIINVSPVAVTAIANAPIGGANLWGQTFYPPATQFSPAATPNAAAPNLAAGFARIHNPREMSARNVSLTAGTTTATTTLTIFGLDVWKAPQSEAITIPSGNRSATTFFGSKAFKFISNIAVNTTAGGNIGVGMGDVFGMVVRADEWEQTQIFWNGCAVPTKLGFNTAATASPNLNTSGDPRGTVQVSTNGTGSAAAVATASVSNNTSRLVIIQNPGVWNTIFGTPNNLTPIFGVANSTT